MTVLCYIQREVLIRPFVFADQPVILITDPDLFCRCLQDCGLATISVDYRIVVAIILDVVIIRNLVDRFVVAYRKCSAWQWFHARFVVFLKGIKPGEGSVLEPPGVENRYSFFDCGIQVLQRSMDLVFQFFDQMCFEVLDVVFYRRLPFLIGNC